MITPMTDVPGTVLGFEASGKIHAGDYESVLAPAIEARLAAGEDVRIVLVFEDWSGMSGDAMWQDLQMGVEHLSHWKKIALVTDIELDGPRHPPLRLDDARGATPLPPLRAR